jgi:hypothetical protein
MDWICVVSDVSMSQHPTPLAQRHDALTYTANTKGQGAATAVLDHEVSLDFSRSSTTTKVPK